MLFVVLVTQHKPLEYANGEPYPYWAELFGFFLSLCSMLCIPVYAIVYVIKAPGNTFREVGYCVTGLVFAEVATRPAPVRHSASVQERQSVAADG
jgi:hypothetical protein